MRIFARVAAVQNLSAVGTELGLTPGTISKRIQALEDELSARLFDRTTRSIRITEEGTAFLTHVERILSEIEAARASVDDKVSKPKGTLKIAAPDLPRRPLHRAGLVRVHALLSRDRGARRSVRPAGQPAGGWLRHRHSHRRAVGLLADRQAPGAGSARHRRLARLHRPRGPAAAAGGSGRPPLPCGRRRETVVLHPQRRPDRAARQRSAPLQQRRAHLPGGRRRHGIDPRLRARGSLGAARRQARAGARTTTRLPATPPSGRSTRAPSTCCRACARCSISSPSGSAR